MDRISRALEKARNKVVRVHNDSGIDVDHDEPIEYSRSRSAPLSSDVLRESRIIDDINDSNFVDAYGLLRTRVLRLMRQNNWKTIGITSPNPSAGKTVTAINLSISISQDQNHSVLLVDADLRKPGISKTLGIESESGLNDYLLAEKPLEDIFVHPEIKHLVVVPTAKVQGGSSELLSSPRMIRFIEQAKQRYPERFVVFDLPPILVGDDVVAISQHLDALLLVVEDGKTQTIDFQRATDLLHDTNCIGVVLNKASADSSTAEY